MRTHRRVGFTIFVLVVCAAAIAVLSPSGSVDPGAKAIQANAVSTPGSSAMRVYLDPETGTVTSEAPQNTTMELTPDLENALRHDDTGLTVEKAANGTLKMNLQDRYEDVTVVRIDANGRRIFCTGDAKTLLRSMNDTTTPTGPEVK
jgi:hypothetical protein